MNRRPEKFSIITLRIETCLILEKAFETEKPFAIDLKHKPWQKAKRFPTQ